MKTRVIIIISIVIVVLIMLGALGFAVKQSQGKIKNLSIKVKMQKATLGQLTETVNATGEIEASNKVNISAKVSARIMDIPFEEGDRVTAGNPDADPPIPPSVLIRLDAKDLESQLRSAEASRDAEKAQIEVEKARILGQKSDLIGLKAKLEKAQLEHERQKKLLASKDISQSAYDEAETTLEELQAQKDSSLQSIKASELNLVVMEHNLKAAEARVERAREELNHTTIVSPIDGIIIRINAKVGEVVMTGTMNNAGTVIMQVADMSKMMLIAEVDEANIGQVKVGQKAKINIQAFWEDEFTGTIEKIALTPDLTNSRTKFYKTEIVVEGDIEKLYSGLTADVDINTKTHNNSVLVPSQAVLERKVDDLPEEIRNDPLIDSKKTFCTVVYKIVNGKTVVNPVKVGPGDLLNTIIEKGLKEGEKVVVGPYKTLETIGHDKSVEDIDEKKKEEKSKSDKNKEKDKSEENDPNQQEK